MSRAAARVHGLALSVGLAAIVAGAGGCGSVKADDAKAPVIVLGFDGMDFALTRKLMAEGRLPSFSRLAKEGSFGPLATSIPPESPVAWADFTTGLDAGGHGIFDFMHRDPGDDKLTPFLSTSRTVGAEEVWELGRDWHIPLSGGSVELLRHGQAFWEVLEEHGIETTIFRIPSNYPPSGTASRELSGMGTPDLLGTYGTFSFYTSDYGPFEGREIGGGHAYEVTPEENVVTAWLRGPYNPYRSKPEKARLDFTVFLDPVEAAAKLEIGEEELILAEGEWSGWVPVTFDLIPPWGERRSSPRLASSAAVDLVLSAADLVMPTSLHAMVRFYLKQVRPTFQLYVTPVNLDPLDPVLPISTPDDFATELARATGRYYTQGMPEDTKSLSEGVLTREEFLAQARISGEEVISQYRHVLSELEGGFLFYYFGNVDLVSHMFWRPMDPEHPTYDAEVDPAYADVVPSIYEELDGIVGYTLERMPEGTTLVVMSDHGFTSYRRAFHLNTWLAENGYLTRLDPDLEVEPGNYGNVDWSRTRAYGLGIAGLYINLEGRENWGIVPAAERERLMEEIAEKLLATVDPASGEPAIARVYRREADYTSRGHLEVGPDLVVGCAKGWRVSDESALGELTAEVFADNASEWAGDHCMDRDAVPGILLTNHPLKKQAKSLKELAAAILAEYGIEGFPASTR